MNNSMRDLFALLAVAVVLALASVSEGLCVEQEPPAKEGGTVTPPLRPSSGWNALFSLSYLPSADLFGTHGPVGTRSVGIRDHRFRLARDLKLDSDVTLTLGGGYTLKQLDAPADVALPRNLHNLYIEAGANYRISKRSFATLKLYPGLSSDFEAITGDDLRMPVLALGGYSFDNGITLVGGLVFRVGYHAANLIPAIGISYQPNERWRVDLIAPRPGVTYIASRQVRLFVAGDFASDEYGLHDRSLGANVIRYRDYKVMGGVDYLPQPALRLSGAVGYAFGRNFDFYDGFNRTLRVDDVPFLKLSLDVGW